MIKTLQIYKSNSTDPYENLAVEKRLLEQVDAETVILYLWQNRRTVVIGKNQNPWAECNCRLLEEEGGKLARRLSGGGAVFHDLGNLNFTFLCHEENYALSRQQEVLLTACKTAGISAERSGRNDLLAEGRKFSGNAFYHSGGKAYHHGTILIDADTALMSRYLTPSKAKLEAKGVKSVRSRVVNLKELAPTLTIDRMKEYLQTAFAEVYGLEPQAMEAFAAEEVAALAAEYADWGYLYGTPLPLSLTCEGRFDWGSVQLQLEIKGGVIQAVRLYTDAMEHTLPEQLQAALTGIRFAAADLKKALSPLLYGEDLLQLIKKNT